MVLQPLVSIIIPMYNAEDFIEETLFSIQSQTYTNYEVIIVDNASTDSSISIAKRCISLFSKCTLIECSENSGGPAKPRNIGIDHSNGEYIAFLDSDDLWDSDKLSYQLSNMLSKWHNFSCISPVAIDEKSKVFSRFRDNFLSWRDKSYGLKSLLFRNTITTSSVVVKRDLLDELRFEETDKYVTCEDYFLWLNLLVLESCSFIHFKEKKVKYRVLNESLGNVNGSLVFAAKALLVSNDFVLKQKLPALMPVVIISHLLRVTKLLLTRSY